MTYRIKLDIAIKLHETSDINKMLHFIEKAGLQECTPYSTLNLIFGSVAVQAIEVYDDIYKKLREIPDIVAIETAVIMQADHDDQLNYRDSREVKYGTPT